MSTRIARNNQARLTLPRGLYALCDDTVRPELGLVEKAERLLAGGAPTLQLRMKRARSREAVEVARAVVRAAHARGALVIINDRVDWALLSGADGVHVGDEDLPPEDARALLGADKLLGVTVRSPDMARAARAAGADYVGLGPLFATSTKEVPAPVLGLEAFGAMCRACPVPVVGIGGIRAEQVADVLAAGAHAAALASDLLRAHDIAERTRHACAASAGAGG